MKRPSKKIEKLLEDEKIKFEIVEHKTTYTAMDTAATTAKYKIKPTEIVKVLVVKADKDHVLVLLPSNKNFDPAKFKKTVNEDRKKVKKQLQKEEPKEAKKIKACKKVELAKESWMKKNLPGKIGAVSPFSRLIKLEIFIERILLRQKNLYLGSGEYEFSIKMTPRNYEKLEDKLVKGCFSKVKKKMKAIKKKK